MDGTIADIVQIIRSNTSQYYHNIQQGSSFQLNWAGMRMVIATQDPNLRLYITHNYEHFVSVADIVFDLYIEVKSDIPESIRNATCVFEARHEIADSSIISPNLWSIHRIDNYHIIQAADAELSVYPYSATVFDTTSNKWTIYIDQAQLSKDHNKAYPLSYPMGPLLMYYAATLNGGVMIHAGGVCYNNKGYLFSGFSGVGKSTMSKLWQNSGAQIINDDRLFIRKKDDGNYYIYNSPMYYSDHSRLAQLHGIYLLAQSPYNYHKPLRGALAVSRLLAFCIQHHHHKNLVENLIDVLANIVTQVPIFELGFLPDHTAVEYILNNTSNSTK